MPKPAAKPAKAVKTRSVWPLLAESALRGYLGPRLAADTQIDLKPVIAALGTPRKLRNGQIEGLKPEAFRVALDAALSGKNGATLLAADADVADVQEVLSQLEDMAPQIADMVVSGGQADPADPNAPPADTTPASPPGPGSDPETDAPPGGAVDPDGDGEVENADPIAKVMEFLADKLSPEDLDQIKALLEAKTVTADKAITKPAMDAAISTALKAQGDRFKAAREAENAVRPYVGPLNNMAFDSADDVYQYALKKLGVKTEGVHPSAFPAILAATGRPRAAVSAPPSGRPLAQDSGTSAKIDFGAARIGLG